MSEPKYLYRYQRLPDKNNPKEKDWLENLFVYNNLWFSSPSSFNDPFDCKITFIFNGTDEECRILLQSAPTDEHRLILRGQIERGSHHDEKWQKEIAELFREVSIELNSNLGIFCLSELNNDILMWSHYSDKHKGFCLEFDSKLLPTDYLQPIIYSETFPNIIDVFSEGPLIAPARLLLYKANHWQYEKEWRWIKFPMVKEELDIQLGNRYYDFTPAMLTGIIFGCEMKKEDRDAIWYLIQSNPKFKHVQSYETVKKPNEFSLDINRILLI